MREREEGWGQERCASQDSNLGRPKRNSAVCCAAHEAICGCTTDVTCTDLPISLCFWALNLSVVLLSMEGQKALGFHQNILICVPKMNQVVINMFLFLGK